MLPVFLTAAGVWFGACWSFVAVMHAKVVIERGGLSLFWKVNIAPLAVLGLLLDAAFNVTFGTVLFRELPRELLFSARVQRHWRADKGDRMAAFWARQLNAIDPDHVHDARE